MNTSQAVVATAVIVTVGRWSQGKEFKANVAVGAAGAAIILSIVAESDPRLAQQFSILLLVTATLTYGDVLAKKVGDAVSKDRTKDPDYIKSAAKYKVNDTGLGPGYGSPGRK